jgi:hypothetical protein
VYRRQRRPVSLDQEQLLLRTGVLEVLHRSLLAVLGFMFFFFFD